MGRRRNEPVVGVPSLPPLKVDIDKVLEVSTDRVERRQVAVVNMRLAGAPFYEIAKELGYSTATLARSAYIQALANMNPPEDWETLRRTEEMRAEQQLARSVAMASAEYLVVHNEDGTEERVPNRDRLRWHEQAGKDLALHAMISGAKAPTRMEVSADSQELNRLVDQIITLQGGRQGDMEADILQIEELPPSPGGDDDGEEA